MGKNKIIIRLFVFLLALPASSQVGIGTTMPEAALDIVSSNAGLLIPRVSLSSSTDITTVTNPNGGSIEVSTLIYNDGTGGLKPSGLFYWNGTSWINMNGNIIGDLKHGFQTNDHVGWYLLDGRAVSSLPTNAQSTAATLGFTGSLPDANNRVLKATDGTQAIASTTGSNNQTITQANLPNFDMTATTGDDGAHTHDYNDLYIGFSEAATALNNNQVAANILTDNPRTTASSGNHNHTVTVNSGGSGTPLNTTPSSLVTNVFIYLGE